MTGEKTIVHLHVGSNEIGTAWMHVPAEGSLVHITRDGKTMMHKVSSVQHNLKGGVRGPYTFGESRIDVVIREVAEI